MQFSPEKFEGAYGVQRTEEALHDQRLEQQSQITMASARNSIDTTTTSTRQLERPGEVGPPLLAQQLNKATSSRDAAAIYLAKMLLPIPCARVPFQKLLALPRF